MASAVDRGDASLLDVSFAVQGQGEQARLLHIGRLLLSLAKRSSAAASRGAAVFFPSNSFAVIRPR
jgi:hypothetical protein